MKKQSKRVIREIKIPKIIPFVSALDAYPELALELHLKLVAATNEPSIDTINQLSKELCIIAGAMSINNQGAPIKGQHDLYSIAIQTAINVIEAISNRHDRTGKVFVSELDKNSLIAAANGLDKVLAKVSKFSYELAALEVEGFINPNKIKEIA